VQDKKTKSFRQLMMLFWRVDVQPSEKMQKMINEQNVDSCDESWLYAPKFFDCFSVQSSEILTA